VTRFVVDSDILANIQRAGFAPQVTALGELPVTITDVVWDELTVGAKAKGAKQATVDEADAMLKAIAGAPTVLQPESPEAGTLVDLQRPPETEGVGEHSVIAYALHHPDDTAVLLDRRALHRGVEELRGRVISFHGFLDVLRGRGLPRNEADQISRWYVQRYVPVRAPLWW
jgi:hypothetical protein